MAGITPLPQQQHLAGSAVSGTSATSGDDDAFKRNTDCVYFLASPLTCKKGSECEYRHSDIARVNPRDCWYWMHGNCLNPKCGFRHPPLEGLFGAQVSTPVGASVPQHQAASTPVAPSSFGSALGKQAVPCVFFQQGYCMKGDWCPFLHAPNSVSNKALPTQAPATAAEPPTLKKSFGGPEKFTQQKMPLQLNMSKAVELPSQVKLTPRVGSAPTKDEPSKEGKHPASVVDQLSRQRTSDVPSFDNGTQVSWSGRVQQPVSLKDNISMNGKDAEEISREPSPGFDVLVDNELGDSVYYPNEDQFGRPDDLEGRSEYFDGHSGDHKSMVDTEQDIYHDSRGYDSYERHQGQHAWEQRRSSSERVLSGLSVNRERSRYGGTGSPDPVHESDLRYHLSKHTRTGGLRSVVNRDHPRERPDHRSYQNSRRDLHQDHERRENSRSSRLQGRIKMAGQYSSSDNGNELQQGWITERQRPQPGLSQGSFQLSSRLHNRIKDAVDLEGHNDNRNKRGLPIRRETRNDDNGDFAGPKSLSELKSRKTFETNDQHLNNQPSDAKRKYSKVEYPQDAAGDLSFDGPKPLQEILKRKRLSSTSEDDNHADKAEQMENETSKSTSGVKIEKDSALLTDGQSLLSSGHHEAEAEGGEMVVEDGAGDQEAENYGAEDDDYYEQADGEAYDLDEGDNGDLEGDYLDDDDDDFAKKMGVMY